MADADPAFDLRVTLPTSLGVAVYPPGATFGPRRMNEYEFVWLIEGDAEYHVDDRIWPVPEGAVALCRPGTTDFFQWDRHRRTRHAFCHFGVTAVPGDWPAAAQWPVVRRSDDPADLLRTLLRHLLTWSDYGDARLNRLTLAHLLACFVSGQIDSGALPPDLLPEAVERATAWLHARLEADAAAPITLGDLADAGAVSREHLCRLFATATGRGPMETVRAARLDRAAVLIARSNLPLKAVAAACGFGSAFHLSRRFAEAYGLPPREVRRRVGEGKLPPQPLLSRTHRTK